MATCDETEHHLFLEDYFKQIGQFSYDKAKEMADKEKDAHKTEVGSSWVLVVTSLYHFSIAERTYMSLAFLNQKWFSRPKENPRAVYSSLTGEFTKATDSETTTSKEKIMAHICGQMCDFLTARHKMMDFYEQLLTLSTNRSTEYTDLINILTEMNQSHRSKFHHPILSSLKSSFTYECDILLHLLQAHQSISLWQFLPALLQLYEAHGKLTAWAETSQPSQTSRRSFGMASSKTNNAPALYVWLTKFKSSLVAKFGLYFTEVLSQQTTRHEMKSLFSRSSDDLMSRISAFHKKTIAQNISIVVDIEKTMDTYKGDGYCHPCREPQSLQGIENYKAILSYPEEKPSKLWPQVVMLINSSLTTDTNKVQYVYDEMQQMTYFLCKIESQIWIVVMFNFKKSEKDTHVNNFLSEFVLQLRCTKLFLNLKPGVKS